MNVLYLTPFFSPCCRRHALIRSACFFLIDFFRLVILFAGVMSMQYIEETSNFGSVREMGIILGVVLMLPTSFYERLVTQRQNSSTNDVSHIVDFILQGNDQSKGQGRPSHWAPREYVYCLLCVGVVLFLAVYTAIVIIFIVNGAEAADHDIALFWDAVEWSGWGLLIGFLVNQIAILWCAALKHGCFGKPDQSVCARFSEMLFVDLRTSILFNDIHSLRSKFE